MRDYVELVKELRYCGDRNNLDCKGCSRKPTPICDDELKSDAADAIEELLARDVVPTDFHERCLQLEIRKRFELEKQLPHWISVEERLPQTDDFVIVAVLDERGDTPYQYTDFGWYLDVASCWIVNAERRRDVTHWTPLPEPPKEVE